MSESKYRTAGPFAATLNPDGSMVVALEGRLDNVALGPLWQQAMQALDTRAPKALIVKARNLEHWDSAALFFFIELRRRQQARNGTFDILDIPPAMAQLMRLFDLAAGTEAVPPSRPPRLAEKVGRAVVQIGMDIFAIIGFIGELTVALGHGLSHPKRIRWRDAWAIVEKAGVDALPIVVMLGGLMGLILAFQSAIPLRRFGADIFVANLVALGLFRELGPLLTAIILAGRSGAAFAAELGTMKINEELNALITMGLDPVRFLVVTRVLAAIFVMPLLTVFANLAGLAGAALVTCSLGFPLVTFKNQVLSFVGATDFIGGLFKSLIFGLLVAAIGCLRGLQTLSGASAVGDAATRAVVSGIVLIVLADGIMAVLFYVLGI